MGLRQIMRKFLFLMFIVVVGFSVNDVQREHVILDWNELSPAAAKGNGEVVLNFDDASFSDSNGILPIYSHQFDLRSGADNFNVILENKVFKEIDLPDEFVIPDKVTETIYVRTYKLQAGDNFKFELQFVPLKREGNKLFALESFDMKRIPVTTKSAKTTASEINWKTESVLKSGKWVKISTSGKGFYKIPYSKLTEWGFSNPSQVNVFGSGGVILSENPGTVEYNDLIQNAVWSGKNEGADCLFFYAPGTVEWEKDGSAKFFEHKLNEYSTKGYYFLSEHTGSTKKAELLPQPEEPATHQVSAFDSYRLHESELENILPHGSGKLWFGEKFKNSSVKKFNFDLSNIENPANISIRISAVARSNQSSKMIVLVNQAKIGELKFNRVNTGSQTSTFADGETQRYSTDVQAGQVEVTAKYFGDNPDGQVDDNAIAWLDFIEVNFREKLKATDKAQFFRDLNSVGSENIVEFTIENSSTSTKVFDVSDANNIKEVALNLSGSTATVRRPANELHEYALVNTDGIFPEPEFVNEVENQDLHSLKTPEFLIITHPNFLNSANNLANFHRSYDNMDVEVVTANQVYNEFSSGSKNSTGIRNFIKMFYDRNDGLKYVLLFGDGSYDNRNIKPETKNFIPTYQSLNSLSPIGSFVTDDYFVMLDADESVYDGAVDLGIGRIPANTTFEAELAVNKVLKYYSPAALGDWRNIVCFMGDDQDDNQTMHMLDSEKLANYVNEHHPEFITDKIYFDAYVQETTPAGERYPGVNEAINNRVKDGVLVLNYVGHANERFLADEHVLDISDINSWSNSDKLPIFVTATCEFSRFDTEAPSAGEYILFNPNGGGIGLFSTTRVVFAYSNFLLSRSFYKFIFSQDENGNQYRMGDIMKLAKNNTINTTNKRNFSLLADPALKLSYPKQKVITTEINGKDAINNQDTIGALQEITVSGYIADNLGNKLDNFNGEIVPIVYDKEIQLNTLGNEGYEPIQFNVQENVIHKGLASVTNGEFTFSFVVPKDISYNLGEGKIIYYAKSGEIDARGAFENFVIGSSSNDLIQDNIGPQIDLFMDSENFKSGDRTSKSPAMLAFLSDENGINTVGNGIGHDITAVLDNDYSNVIVLNSFYQSNLDDFTSGSIIFPFQNLSVGTHNLKLKAWDVANNSTEVEIDFEVTGNFTIESVTNYPNPMQSYTFFTFEHNQAGTILETIVEIFDLSGRRIDYISQPVASNGTTSNPIRWDLHEANIQIKNGIYVYRITAKNGDGTITSKSGKIMISQ